MRGEKKSIFLLEIKLDNFELIRYFYGNQLMFLLYWTSKTLYFRKVIFKQGWYFSTADRTCPMPQGTLSHIVCSAPFLRRTLN